MLLMMMMMQNKVDWMVCEGFGELVRFLGNVWKNYVRSNVCLGFAT
jgi:hypothetical protein